MMNSRSRAILRNRQTTIQGSECGSSCCSNNNVNGFTDILSSLGNPDQPLVTAEVAISPQSLIMLTLGVLLAGVAIKKL